MSRVRYKKYSFQNTTSNKQNLIYHKINKTSKYPFEYQFIDQDFTSHLIWFYEYSKDIIPYDLIHVIFHLIYYEYLHPHYEFCPNRTPTFNNRKLEKRKWSPCDFCGNCKECLDVHTISCGNCVMCIDNVKCKFRECKTLLQNSLYCKLHMMCEKCGGNRRLAQCKHH